jgi:hypothetical protein
LVSVVAANVYVDCEKTPAEEYTSPGTTYSEYIIAKDGNNYVVTRKVT